MDLDLDASTQEFRLEVRQWLAENVPSEPLPHMDTREGFEAHREWERTMADARMSVVSWPEEFGGQGADSVAACIVIEEVARVDASASLIPAVNKLGTMGLILAGGEELKQKVLPEIAAGKMASYALSEREAGSDAASMRTRAKADGDDWILNGSKAWITNGGKSTWYTVMAVTDPEKGASGISAFLVNKDDEGFGVSKTEKKLGIKGSPTAELYFEDVRIPGDRILGEEGTGFKTALRTLDDDQRTSSSLTAGVLAALEEAAREESETRVTLAGTANLARTPSDFPLSLEPVLPGPDASESTRNFTPYCVATENATAASGG